MDLAAMAAAAKALAELKGIQVHVVVHRPPTVILAGDKPGQWRVFSTVNYLGKHRKGDIITSEEVKALVDDPSLDVEIN